MPWTKYNFIRTINRAQPKAIFLTGDISNGAILWFDLMLLGKFIKCPIYFVLGNHDYAFHSIAETHEKIKQICAKYPNLVWLTDQQTIILNDNTALIGTEGWYDAEQGNPKYLQLTFDWFSIKDFLHLPDMQTRIEAFRQLANESCKVVEHKLLAALEQGFQHIYLCTHVPPWKEGTRDQGTFLEKFWLPYNANVRLGKTIEKIMKQYPTQYVTVLAGHTHTDTWVQVSPNIECKVNAAKYYGMLRNEEHLFV